MDDLYQQKNALIFKMSFQGYRILLTLEYNCSGEMALKGAKVG